MQSYSSFLFTRSSEQVPRLWGVCTEECKLSRPGGDYLESVGFVEAWRLVVIIEREVFERSFEGVELL